MPTCLITGGAGFVGSHLATRMVHEGWHVRVLDDLSTGKRANLAHLTGRVAFLQGSILQSDLLDQAVQGVDVVFHHAAMVSVPQSVAEPFRCHEICATGTLQVLRASAEAGVQRVVYAASSSAYGDAQRCPIDEDHPVHAKSPYAAAKLAGEHYCTAFAETTPLETVRLRYFNIFGPRQDPSSPYSGVISIFCTKMLRGESPTIHGDGLQSRDFVFVDDVVQANWLAATSADISGRVLNIGTGRRQTVRELFDTLNRVLGTRIEPRYTPARTGDVRDSQADISAARAALRFEPVVTFEQGIAACVQYYRTITSAA